MLPVSMACCNLECRFPDTKNFKIKLLYKYINLRGGEEQNKVQLHFEKEKSYPIVRDLFGSSPLTWGINERGCCNLCGNYGSFGNLITEFADFCEIKSKFYNDMDIRNHNMNFLLFVLIFWLYLMVFNEM